MTWKQKSVHIAVGYYLHLIFTSQVIRKTVYILLVRIAVRNNKKKSRLKRSASPQLNPALVDFTPQELIEQLRALGYKGSLEYVETKTHLIKL